MRRSPPRRPSSLRRNPEYDEDAYRRALAGDKNLQGANLQGADLADANLVRAILEGADLSDTNLRGANLQGANLEAAHLAYANLAGANLAGANLRDANLEYANLSLANLVRAYLEGANLVGANLKDAYLLGANLVGANLVRANLEGADLEDANLRYVNLRGANLRGANLRGAELSETNLQDADLQDAYLRSADLRNVDLRNMDLRRAYLDDANLVGANLKGADLQDAYLRSANLRYVNLRGADLRRAYLDDANLVGANLQGADLRGANLEGANLEGANIEGANVTGTILEKPPVTRPSRSFGRQTGAVLKMGKPDAPSRATDFKKKYPAEFERLKADTQGRDFSDAVRSQVRQKYETPFVWLVTDGTYDGYAQRLCPDPNLVYKFNIALTDPTFTERQREFLKKLAETSRRSEHPYEKGSLFTVGWVRLCVNEATETWLVEEVQSDVGVVREKLKDGSLPDDLADYEDVIEEMRPYLDRFYEDALGVVFMEAEKRGYAVEMLTYETKKPMGSPRSVYTDLPRAMGMQKQPKSKVLRPEVLFSEPVWYYKPNPRPYSRASSRSSGPSRGARSTRKPKGRR